MKILQVNPYFFVGWAGGREGSPVETVYGLSRELVKRGHEVAIYTTDAFNKSGRNKKQAGETEIDGIRVHEFSSIGRTLGIRHHIIISPSLAEALRREISQFDVLHLHEYRTLPNITAHRQATKHGIPYVLQAHGSVPVLGKRVLKQAYDRLWGRRILSDASKLIAVSEMEAEHYRASGVAEEQITVVPNAIDLSLFSALPEKGVFKRKHGMADKRMVLFLGRIAPVKGIDLLIRAFALLLKEVGDVSLVIAGPDDGDLSSLKNLTRELKVEGRVLFPGALHGRAKLEAYVDAEVYVLPSVYDIFGITVLEALACGTPVIVTDRCGIAGDIKDRAGIVVSREERALKEAMSDLLADGAMRRMFITQGRQMVREKFTWERVAEKIEEIYNDILAGRASSQR